jgi:putative MATE family efflux protein
VLSSVVTLSNFLTYGTTAQVARLHGAGQDRKAGAIAAQSLYLALLIGAVTTTLTIALADPLMALVGGHGETADLAARYLRISALGLPAALIALAGQGYLRGVGDLRSPLVVVVAANAFNIVLELLFVYAFGWGLDGSAAGTVIAQAGMGLAFATMLLRAPATSRAPNAAQLRSLAHMGGHIVIRTGSLLLAFLVAGAVLARTSDAALGAHQIAFQVFIFLALVLDAIAIAGQVLVGRLLGAGDAQRAVEAAHRMILWSLVGGVVMGAALLATTHLLPHAFSSDDAVLHEAATLWPLFALMQPVGALVFALDGILLGAGDTRYLAYAMAFSALGVFLPIALLTAHFDWGVTGVWAGIDALMVARLATIGSRYRSRRWVVTGASATAA